MASPSAGWASHIYSSLSTPKILTLVAITFLGIACHQIIQRGSKESSATPQSNSRTQTPVISSASGVTRSRFSTLEKSSRIVRKKSHQASDLNHFYLPPVDLANIALEAAGKIIIAKYETICRETGAIPLPLIWKVNSDKAHIKEIHLAGRFLSICHKLALVSGTQFERRGDDFIFNEIPEVPEGPIETRQFTVPPTFMTWFDNFPNMRSPDTGEEVFQEIPRVDPTTSFWRAGLLGTDETVRYETNRNQLVVNDRNRKRISGTERR
jgi:hypothetical protein